VFGRDIDASYGAAVLLSDGEDVEGKLYGAIAELKAARIHTFAVGVGTPDGTTIPERNAQDAPTVHHDWAGRVVVTHLVENNLRDIARETGGTYVRWAGDASVAPIVAALSQLRRRAIASREQPPRAERFQWPLALAFVALAAESVVSQRRRRRRTS
jgi:Ca-activated chloride channel homolog